MMKPLNQRKVLNRRNMLRGTGAVIAFPFLESLSASSHVEASESTADNGTRETPMRMVCIGLEYGLYPSDFFPKRTGRDYELPRLLSPLAGLKNEFTVFSGLDHPGISGGHQATHTFLSGIRSNQAKQYPCRHRSENVALAGGMFSGIKV